MNLAPWIDQERTEAGCDEAGRGCLAGPVTAGAVILSPSLAMTLCQEGVLNDSKQLTERKRNELRKRIESEALAWAVSHVDPRKIEEINILQSSFLAMRQAVQQLDINPQFLLIDGNRFQSQEGFPSHGCFIKGDARFASIAAASVLAKTHRDERMRELALVYPGYGWERNAGYPTKSHRQAIRDLGLNDCHRRTFRQLPEQGNLLTDGVVK
ncbi:MAG: ribonuclease HII [Flavobacteriales bacterium]|nr:ribonuclease HII [Flavobacteriales bacterium]